MRHRHAGMLVCWYAGMLAGTFGWLVAVVVRCGWRAQGHARVNVCMTKTKITLAFVSLAAPPGWLFFDMHNCVAVHTLPRRPSHIVQDFAQLGNLVFQMLVFVDNIHVCRHVCQIVSLPVCQIVSLSDCRFGQLQCQTHFGWIVFGKLVNQKIAAKLSNWSRWSR